MKNILSKVSSSLVIIAMILSVFSPLNVSAAINTGFHANGACSGPAASSLVVDSSACVKATGLGNAHNHRIDLYDENNNLVDSTTPATGNQQLSFVPGTCGTWTANIIKDIDSSLQDSATIEVTGCNAEVTFTLSYSAGSNGSLTGSSTQVVLQGADGSEVTAVPDSGYLFVDWTGDAPTNTTSRTDTNVQGDVTAQANFTATACNDGLDNDSDELADYPADLGCENIDDNDEENIVNPPVDTEPPVVTADDIIKIITTSTTTVDYVPAPTAYDDFMGTDTSVICEPVSGSEFAIGTTTVTCTSEDDSGNVGTTTFDVIVIFSEEPDNTPPVMDPHADVTATTTATSTVVTYTNPTATDDFDGVIPVVCEPASGTEFALGTTTVNCSATDSNENQATSTFDVIVTQVVNPPEPTTGVLVIEKNVLASDNETDVADNTSFVVSVTDGESTSTSTISENSDGVLVLPFGQYTITEATSTSHTLVSISSSTVSVVAGTTTVLVTNKQNSVTPPNEDDNAQCSDGLDNDNDGDVDYPADSGCSNADDDTEQRSSSGSSGGGRVNTPVGEVLGASTDAPAVCSIYLRDYLKMGGSNNVDEVLKLQIFLNLQGISVPVTGFFGQTTDSAVKAFQVRNGPNVLQPWIDLGLHNSLETGTGYVYKTTNHLINKMVCPSLQLPLPQLP